jgi:hypothetical protein
MSASCHREARTLSAQDPNAVNLALGYLKKPGAPWTVQKNEEVLVSALVQVK